MDYTYYTIYLTVDGIAMAISRMAPSHFLWKKPYKCWDTVSQLCRLRLGTKLHMRYIIRPRYTSCYSLYICTRAFGPRYGGKLPLTIEIERTTLQQRILVIDIGINKIGSAHSITPVLLLKPR